MGGGRPGHITDQPLKLLDFKPSEVAHGQLYDLLLTLTEGEAKTTILNVGEDIGLNAYRKLSALYGSCGKAHELERRNRLVTFNRSRNIHEAPWCAEARASDWAVYTDRAGEDLPERLRTNILLRMVPAEFQEEIRLRYAPSDIGWYWTTRGGRCPR